MYQDVQKYLKNGEIPETVSSTRANFIATAEKYAINARGYLTRQNKPVVLVSEQDAIFEAFHDHAGRTACWERIKAR